jgi:hypothetical protein
LSYSEYILCLFDFRLSTFDYVLERCPRGRRGRFAKPLYCMVPGVRIPISPKGNSVKLFDTIKNKTSIKIERLRALLKNAFKITCEKYSYYRVAIFSDENKYYFAAISFVPFLGWLIPLYLKKEDEFSQYQSKMGFHIALYFTIFPWLLLMITMFSPKEFRIFRLILVIMIYLSHLAYFSVCAYGIRLSINGKKFEIPDNISYITRYLSLIRL